MCSLTMFLLQKYTLNKRVKRYPGLLTWELFNGLYIRITSHIHWQRIFWQINFISTIFFSRGSSIDHFCKILISGQPFQRRFLNVFQSSSKLYPHTPHPTWLKLFWADHIHFSYFCKKLSLKVLVHIPAIGFQMIISIETYRTCNFPGGSGPPIPTLDLHMQ